MDKLPDDIIFNIVQYLSFWNQDVLNYKNSNKRYYFLCMKKINLTINKNIRLINESFFQKAMRYRILNKRLIDQLETDRIDMLIKHGWI
jgi:hypothetical protein